MLGLLHQSCLNLSSFLWEPIGVLFYIGLLWFIWNHRKSWKDHIVWLIACGLSFAIAWRLFFHISTGRYYGFFIVPALFFSFYLLWCGPWSKRTSYVLLGILLIGCTARDFWYNPMEHSVLLLYETVRKDAQEFKRVTALSFSKGLTRERYYTGLTIAGVDRRTSLNNILSGMKYNFSVYDGDWDAVYFFLEIHSKEIDHDALLKWSSNAHLTIIGESWLDRHRKKKVIVFRYLPDLKRDDKQCGDLLPNGDFREYAEEKINIQMQKNLGQRAVRFLNENPIFPKQWGIYHSLIGKSDSFATIVKRPYDNALRLEADNYLAAISPTFSVEQERILSFSISVKTESVLQITRDLKFTNGSGGDLYPLLSLYLKPGLQRRFFVRLPARPDCKSGAVWFWLHHGILELSDVRIK